MKKLITLGVIALLAISIAACSTNSTASTSTNVASQQPTETSEPEGLTVTQDATTEAPTAGSTEEKAATHDEETDYTWDEASVSEITLTGDSATAADEGVTIDGSVVTIIKSGTYRLKGTLSDGQVVIDTADKEVTRLLLAGVDITSTTSAPVYIANAKKAVIILEEGSQNFLTDGNDYVYANSEENEPNAALFSMSDLTIAGDGSLVVTGNFNDGISSKDGLILAGENITVEAADDGIRGKDYIYVKNGNLYVNAGGDGLKSDNEDDATKGYITITDGNLQITSGGDGISAQTDVIINSGDFTLYTGGGSTVWMDDVTSAKGIKGTTAVTITGGTFSIDSADDAIHSNGDISISGGSYQIASGDDGMHADTTLTIDEGKIAITNSYEGIESATITINGGELRITSSDDGINVAGGTDGSGMDRGIGGPAGFGNPPDQGTMPQPGSNQFPGNGTMPGQDMFSLGGDYWLYLNGGYIYVNALGDGVDSNGSIEMTGGTLIISGPTENMNGALDYMGTFNISGGILVATGSAGMVQAPSESSTQNSVTLVLDAVQAANTLFTIQAEAGDAILSVSPTKAYQAVTFSSVELANGAVIDLYTGGSSTGEIQDDLVAGGKYSPGDLIQSVTLSSTVTTIGNSIGFGGGHRR